MRSPIWGTFLIIIMTLFLAGPVRAQATGGGVFGSIPPDEDTDHDGVPDETDNCPVVANPDQNDSNSNEIGDACVGDWDGDGVEDSEDNCWEDPNPNQADLDLDGVGNLCDRDRDGDGYTNDFEGAIVGTNPDLWDSDGDRISDYFDCAKNDPLKASGDDCNTIQIVRNIKPVLEPKQDLSNPFDDDDGDGVLNGDDNCPEDFNPGQQDQDHDGRGDLCDNGSRPVTELLFARGGGGLGMNGCSLAPAVSSEGISPFCLMVLALTLLLGFKSS